MITGEYGLLPRLAVESTAVRNQLAQVQEQVATGLVSQTYAGLGNSARVSLDLRPALAHQATWQSNIDAAQGRLSITQAAMTTISSIAADFFSRANSLSTGDASSVQGLAAAANTALQQVAQLLNTKSGDLYVFAGQDTSNPPVPNTDPAVVGSAVLASDTSTAPFSSTLGTAVPTVEVGEGQRLQVGLLANRNTLTTSSPPTTGSYMRDTLKALAGLAAMTPGSSAASAAASAAGGLRSAISAMSSEVGALGGLQSTLTQRKSALADTATTLSTQLDSVEQVDMPTAISKASALQTQLQASYQIIGQSGTLSLASYI